MRGRITHYWVTSNWVAIANKLSTMTLADRVRKQREAKGWSQADLAAAVNKLGGKLSQQNAANIEAGIVKNPKCIVQLATALEVSPVFLQTGKGHKEMIGHNAPPPAPDNQPPPMNKTQRAILNYDAREEITKDLLNLLRALPEGSEAEKRVFRMLRRLNKDGDK
jgi:transcriptional regulator with XRE-family HTH domain